MKIYKKVIVDIESMEVVEEESYNYFGPVALCGGSGGGNSGQVAYPTHMTAFHTDFMDHGTVDTLTSSVVDLVNAAVGASPFSGVIAYDPDIDLANMASGVFNFAGAVSAMDYMSDWGIALTEVIEDINAAILSPVLNTPAPDAPSNISDNFGSSSNTAAQDIKADLVEVIPTAASNIAADIEALILDSAVSIAAKFEIAAIDAVEDIKSDFESPTVASEGEIAAAVDAFEAIADDHITTDVLPRFQAGMRDINAVQSSAFTLGQSNIESMSDRDVAKFQGDLRVPIVMQADQIQAESLSTKNKLISDVHINDDNISAAATQLKNQLLGNAYIQDDQLKAKIVELRNQLVGNAYLGYDSIDSVITQSKNDLISRAHLQDDVIDGQIIVAKGNTISQAYMQEDKILSDDINSKNLINADLEKVRRGMIISSVDRTLTNFIAKIEFEKAVMHYISETSRIKIVAKKEETDQQLAIDESDGMWDLESTQYAGNALAAIGSAVGRTGKKQPSVAASAIGGALSGAAAGAALGPMGALAGGILGGIGGLF